MTPIEAIRACSKFLPAQMFKSADQSVPLLLAIQRQEAPNQEQKQIGGPAVGIFQFEKAGGIREVITNRNTRDHAAVLCAALGVDFEENAVYRALQGTNDTLDAGFARLFLWSNRNPLPRYGDVEGAWQYYLATWRPGAYTRGNASQRQALRSKWARNYASAMQSYQQW